MNPHVRDQMPAGRRKMRASMARLLQFSGVLAVAACGGGDPSGPGTPWVGDWELTLENGVVPSGYASTLTIQTGSFTSTFDSAAQSCSWSGTLTATSTEITWSYDSATGPPATWRWARRGPLHGRYRATARR